jgi:hypothetical protein
LEAILGATRRFPEGLPPKIPVRIVPLTDAEVKAAKPGLKPIILKPGLKPNKPNDARRVIFRSRMVALRFM